jgi:hypothetical protein
MRKFNWKKWLTIVVIALDVVLPMLIYVYQSTTIIPVAFPVTNTEYIYGEDTYNVDHNYYIDIEEVSL